jgi:hypothetical protein
MTEALICGFLRFRPLFYLSTINGFGGIQKIKTPSTP